MRNCTVASNLAFFGGGVFFDGKTPGGTTVDELKSSLSIDNCEFVANTAVKSGGAIDIENSGNYSQPGFEFESQILATAFSGNTAGTSKEQIDRLKSGGGAIHIGTPFTGTVPPESFSDVLTIHSCLFSSNSVRGGGSAILLGSYPRELGVTYALANAHIYSCTFSMNDVILGRPWMNFGSEKPGGAVFVDNPATALGTSYYNAGAIRNCIFWGNEDQYPLPTPGIPSTEWTDDVRYAQFVPAVSQLPREHCDIERVHLITNQLGAPYPGDGNLNVDPEFLSPPLGDFRLQVTSRCIDAGSPGPTIAQQAFLAIDWVFDADMDSLVSGDLYNFDLDFGNDRIVDGPASSTCPGTGSLICGKIDMGAYEYQN